MNILERIRRGGDRAAGTEMPRQPEPWVEISESVSWLCSFDAVGGSISVKVIQDSRPIHDKMVDSFLEQIFSIRVATYPAQATAVSWILKDGMQHAGKLIYSSMGAKMDSEPKSWRILADVLYDLGTALEVISPLCPQLFLKWQTWETLRRETISTLFNVMGIGAGNGLASTLCSTTQRKEIFHLALSGALVRVLEWILACRTAIISYTPRTAC